MKKIIVISAILSAVVHPSSAEEVVAAPASNEQPAGGTLAVKSPRLATFANDEFEDGDLMFISRPFGHWVMRCEWMLSTQKRICSIEQQALVEGVSVVWKIAPQIGDERPLLVIQAPRNMIPAAGMRLSFSGLEKTLPADDWFCTDNGCLSSFPFDGFLGAAITNSPQVSFSFSIDEAGQKKPVQIVGIMDGYKAALNAVTNDPFGSQVRVKAEESAKKKPGETKAPESGQPKSRPQAAVPAPRKASTMQAKNDTRTRRATGLY